MGDFKTCDIHGKEFPANLIDTTKHEMAKLYAERTMTIEGKKVKLALFIGKNESEGADTCLACMTEKLVKTLSAMGIETSWKNVTWVTETIQKKDGSGTYQRNVPVVKTVEELAEEIKAEKAAKQSPQVAQPPSAK